MRIFIRRLGNDFEIVFEVANRKFAIDYFMNGRRIFRYVPPKTLLST